jgi:hypothetical protein
LPPADPLKSIVGTPRPFIARVHHRTTETVCTEKEEEEEKKCDHENVETMGLTFDIGYF